MLIEHYEKNSSTSITELVPFKKHWTLPILTYKAERATMIMNKS